MIIVKQYSILKSRTNKGKFERLILIMNREWHYNGQIKHDYESKTKPLVCLKFLVHMLVVSDEN